MQKQMKLLDLPDPDWIALLQAEVAKGKTKADVAREIGMPRPSLSLLLAGKYPAKMDRKTRLFAHKVVALYANRVRCPHLREAISNEACATHAAAPMSISSPEKLALFRACRDCPHNPTLIPTTAPREANAIAPICDRTCPTRPS